jgi:hypothetical protein
MIYNYHDMNLACVKNKSSLGHAIQSSLRGGKRGMEKNTRVETRDCDWKTKVDETIFCTCPGRL